MRNELDLRPNLAGKVWYIHFLRACAALTVIVYHLGYQLWNDRDYITNLYHLPAPEGSAFPLMLLIDRLIDFRINIGMIAVGVFFLISGFLIPLSLEKIKNSSAGNFIFQKILRIYPTHWIVLAIGLIIALLSAVIFNTSYPYDLGTIISNLLLIPDLTRTPFISGVLWTLVVEVAFYIIAGVILLPSKARSASQIVLISLGLFGFNWIASALGQCNNWESLTCGAYKLSLNITQYIIFILLGTCIYNFYKKHWNLKKLLAVSGIVYLLFILAAGVNQLIYGQDVQVSYSISLLIFISAYLFKNIIPYSRGFDFIANISFPLFLIHTFIGNFVGIIIYKLTGSELLAIALGLLIIFPVSYALHRLVEIPSIKLSKRLSSSSIDSR